MKINRLETHDRLLEFQKQWQTISQGCQECIRNVPEEITSPFYVFAHGRTVGEDEKIALLYDHYGNPSFNMPSLRLIWSPRITKPKAQPNSFLFMAQKSSDVIKIIWLLPRPEMWEMFEPGKMTHNPDIWTSILNYKNHREKLNEPEPDGPTAYDEDKFRRIYAALAQVKRSNL